MLIRNALNICQKVIHYLYIPLLCIHYFPFQHIHYFTLQWLVGLRFDKLALCQELWLINLRAFTLCFPKINSAESLKMTVFHLRMNPSSALVVNRNLLFPIRLACVEGLGLFSLYLAGGARMKAPLFCIPSSSQR